MADADRPPSTRILVVDDHQLFRRFVVSMLEDQPELQIIGEAQDGLEAVQKAGQLKPELILLDIGLPKLNGLDAARQICKLLPGSKILFVSQESSADIMQEALCTGAMGYVVKVDAGTELLDAIAALLRGEQFVSKRFAGYRTVPPPREST
jgi:DNA-binding NarL/FixJ family response regulator